MSATSTVQIIVAITIALVLFGLIVLPMVQSSLDETKDGDPVSVTQTGYSTGLSVYKGDSITVDATSKTATGGHTLIVTSTQVIEIVSGASVTLYDSAGMRTPTENITVDASEESLILVDSDVSPTYGLWTVFGDGHELNAKTDSYLFVFDRTVGGTAFAYERYDGKGIGLTTNTVDGQKDVRRIMAVDGPSGAVIAPIEYVYFEQIPMLDDNMKALIEVIPVLMVLGVMLVSAGMLIRRY